METAHGGSAGSPRLMGRGSWRSASRAVGHLHGWLVGGDGAERRSLPPLLCITLYSTTYRPEPLSEGSLPLGPATRPKTNGSHQAHALQPLAHERAFATSWCTPSTDARSSMHHRHSRLARTRLHGAQPLEQTLVARRPASTRTTRAAADGRLSRRARARGDTGGGRCRACARRHE